jgi:hypothetical protein
MRLSCCGNGSALPLPLFALFAGEGGVGVPQQNALVEGTQFPPPDAFGSVIGQPNASTSPPSGRGDKETHR